MADLGTARGRIIIDSAGARAGLTSAASGIAGFGKAALGLTAGIGAAVLLGKAISSTVSVGAEFEQQLSNLKAVSGATAGQMGKLTKQALDLGASTKFSANEVAGAQTELVKAGSTVQEVLGGALDASLALAAAGEVDLAQAATVVSGALNVFGLAAKDAGQVADILASTANTTATDIGNLGMSFTQGASAAKQAGLPIQDFTAMLGALAESNVIGSDAGTSLKAALLSLVAPIGRGKEAIKKYGLEFFKANGDIKGAVGIAQELRAKLGGLTREQRLGVLASIAGRDGFRALAAAYDLGPAAIGKNITASMKLGTAAEVARVKQDNLRGDVEKLGGAIETMQIKAGGAVTGGLRVLTQGAIAAIEGLSESENVAAFGEGLLALGQGAAAAVSSLAPLASAMGSLAGTAAGALGSITGLAGGFLGSAAGAATLRVALVGLVAAYAAVKVAAVGATVATKVSGLMQTAGAFVSLGSSVRTTGGAMSFLGAAAPKTAAAVAGLRGVATQGAFGMASLAAGAGTVALPMLGVAAAVGVVAGGVALLASGFFSGGSLAASYAAQIAAIGPAAQAAASGLAALRGAVGGVKDAHINETTALLNLKAARVADRAVQASSTATDLQKTTSTNSVTVALRNYNKARQATAIAEAASTKASLDQTVAASRVITALSRGEASTKQQIGLLRTLGLSTKDAAAKSGELTTRLDGIRAKGGTAAAQMNVLRGFLKQAAQGMDQSTSKGAATAQMLTRLSNTPTAGLVKFAGTLQKGLDAGLPKAQAVQEALAGIKPPPKIKVEADDKATPKIKKVAGVKIPPKDTKVTANVGQAIAGISSVISLLGSVKSKSVTLTVHSKQTKSSWTAEEMIKNLRIEPKKRSFLVEFKKTDPLDAQGAFDNSRIIAQREVLSAKLAQIERAEEDRQAKAEARRTAKAVSNARAELARAKTSDEKASAKRALADAKAALAEFRITTKVEAKRTAVEAAMTAREGIIEGMRSGGDSVRGALQDIGQRLGESIDRGVQSAIEGHAAGLKATLADVAASPEAARIAAIGLHVDAAREARTNRDSAKQATELAKTQVGAAELVARRRATLAKARTASEQQAAQALLDLALADELTATTALSDFREDQALVALDREKAALELGLQARRDAAQKAHDEAVAAATAEGEARKTALDLQLGDLAERLDRGLIKRKQFNKELAAIMGDPKLAADLERSGRELGLAFSRGLERAISGAEAAAEGLARSIAKYLKLKSPAKTGPLAHDFRRSGATLVRDLAAGMLSQRGAIERASAGVAGAMATRAALVGAGATQGGGGGTTHQTTINVDGPTLHPRTLAAELAWEAQNGGRR